jgi:hypothetical protein
VVFGQLEGLMAGLIVVVLLARWFPHVLLGMAAAVCFWLVFLAGFSFIHADPDRQLALVLLAVIVGGVAGAAWLLIRLLRTEQPVVKQARREPHI